MQHPNEPPVKHHANAATITRFAEVADVPAVYAMGVATDVFKVSDALPFYTERELTEWCEDRSDNLLMVAECDGRIVAFSYCKQFSYRWAFLETGYVDPAFRTLPAGNLLRDHMIEVLRIRGVSMMTMLVREDHKPLVRLAERFGWQNCGPYIWMNLML
jgi:L-amino acid N-acyltransferase YncA